MRWLWKSSLRRRASNWLFIAFGMSLGSFLVQWYSGPGRRSFKNEHAGLYVSPDRLNLGLVWDDPSIEIRVPIENRTPHRLQIARFHNSCGCTAVKPGALVIEPQGSTVATISLDLQTRSVLHGSQPRPFAVHIVPELVETCIVPAAWTIHGTVRRRFIASPPHLSFGDVVAGETPSSSRGCRILSRTRLQNVYCKCPPGLASGAVVADRGSTYDLQVTLSPCLPVGSFQFDVVLAGQEAATGDKCEFKLPVAGRIVDVVQLIPDVLRLGIRRLGDVVEEDVVIRSRSGAPLYSISASSNETDTSVSSSFTIPSGHSFAIRQEISAAGFQRREIAFEIQESHGSSPRTIFLRLEYYGTQAAVSVRPARADRNALQLVSGPSGRYAPALRLR